MLTAATGSAATGRPRRSAWCSRCSGAHVLVVLPRQGLHAHDERVVQEEPVESLEAGTKLECHLFVIVDVSVNPVPRELPEELDLVQCPLLVRSASALRQLTLREVRDRVPAGHRSRMRIGCIRHGQALACGLAAS
jgi:hypothetical protein